MDRLSLKKIMDRQLSQTSLHLSTASLGLHENKRKVIYGSKKSPSKFTDLNEPAKKIAKKKEEAWLSTDYPESVKKIINHVHSRMQPQPVDVEAKIAAIPAIITPTTPTSIKKQKKQAKGSNKNQINRAKSVLTSNYMSIPQIKAEAQTKALQNERRQSLVIAQERTREIIAQKRMLQEMLLEHQKLQRDRANIASEIQTMKSYLGDIKKRLDTSLNNLDMNAKIARR